MAVQESGCILQSLALLKWLNLHGTLNLQHISLKIGVLAQLSILRKRLKFQLEIKSLRLTARKHMSEKNTGQIKYQCLDRRD